MSEARWLNALTRGENACRVGVVVSAGERRTGDQTLGAGTAAPLGMLLAGEGSQAKWGKHGGGGRGHNITQKKNRWKENSQKKQMNRKQQIKSGNTFASQKRTRVKIAHIEITILIFFS